MAVVAPVAVVDGGGGGLAASASSAGSNSDVRTTSSSSSVGDELSPKEKARHQQLKDAANFMQVSFVGSTDNLEVSVVSIPSNPHGRSTTAARLEKLKQERRFANSSGKNEHLAQLRSAQNRRRQGANAKSSSCTII